MRNETTCRAPPEKMNKGVKDKYVWKKEQKKADEEVCSALKSRVLVKYE